MDESQDMTDDLSTSSLQEEQKALLARIYEEPNTASVLEAMDRLYSQTAAAFNAPTYTTTFGAGTNKG